MPKITDLNELTTPTFSDVLPIVDLDNNETKKVSIDSILDVTKDRPMEFSSVTVSNQLVVGNSQDYVEIGSTGDVRLRGESTTWNDILVPLTTTKIGSNDRPLFVESEIAYAFPQNNTTERMFFTVQMPHSWEEGSVIYPHVHWKQSLNLNPTFVMEYKWFNVGETIPATWTTLTINSQTQPYTGGDLHQVSRSLTGIDGSGKKLSSFILIVLYRNDNVYTGNVLTYQFDIHYRIDSFGSNFEYVK